MNLPFPKSPQGDDPVRLDSRFSASVDRVYRAWAEPAQMAKWFGPGQTAEKFEADVRVGGGWQAIFPGPEGAVDRLSGEYLAVEPSKRLVFSWVHERKKPDGTIETTAVSQVTVSFEPADGGTRLSLRHEGIVSEDGRKGVFGGWTKGLQALSQLLESGEDS